MTARIARRTGLLAATTWTLTLGGAGMLPCMSASAANVPQVDAAGRLESVLVRSDGATMERTVTARVPAGPSRIVLHGLPVSSQAGGMQVSGAAEGRLSIGSTNLRRTTAGVQPAASARKAALEAELQDVRDRVAQLDVAAAGAKATRDAVTSLLAHPGQDSDPRALVALARDATSEAAESMRVIEVAKRPLAARIRAIEDEMVRMGTEASAQSTDLIVDVEAEKEGEVRLSVRHDVAEASWSSAYEARLDTRQRALGLVQVALVRQGTGEDWNDVRLVLSSGRVQRGSSPPAGRGELLSFQPPAPPPAPMAARSLSIMPTSGGAPGGVSVNAEMAQALRDGDSQHAPMAPAFVPGADIDVRGVAVEYSIGGKVSVPSRSATAADVRGLVNSVSVMPVPRSQEAERFRVADLAVKDAAIRSVAVPAQGATAWLQAEFRAPGTAPLPSGPVILDVDGARVGEGSLPAMSPGEPVVLGFGSDPAVKVAYDPQEGKQSSEFSLGGRRSINSKAALVTVRNAHGTPWDVRILEPVPVSGDEDIKVEATMDPAPASTRFSDTPGLYAWTFTLAVNEERRIRTGWTVTSPNGKPVVAQPTRFSLEKR